MNKTLIKSVSIGMIAVGCVGLFIGGGTEGYAIEIVSSIFAVVGTIVALIKKG